MNSEGSIIVEQTFDNSMKQVWEAITDINQLKQWFFEQIEEFNPVIGFETQFVVKVEQRTFTHLWKLIEVTPQKKIVYNWKYEEYNGDSNVSFELFNLGSKTKLVVTHLVLKPFPSNIPEFNIKSGIEGWNYFIKDRLPNHLKL